MFSRTTSPRVLARLDRQDAADLLADADRLIRRAYERYDERLPDAEQCDEFHRARARAYAQGERARTLIARAEMRELALGGRS